MMKKMVIKEASLKEKIKGRCVLVSVQIDGGGRQLLTWALDKVAEHGDRIVAVHACLNSDPCDTSTLSLIKDLDEYLASYEGFCNLKQLALVGRVSRGRSIREVIVREAELCTATKVVVGVGKNYFSGGSTSLAKYCAKKLPPTTTLIAVHNGKVIFERGASKLTQEQEPPKPNLRHFLQHSVSLDPNFEDVSDKETPSISDLSDGRDSSKGEPSSDLHCLIHEMASNDDPNSISVLLRNLPERPGWPLLRNAWLTNPEASILLRNLPERPGWPLLRNSWLTNPEASKDSETRKLSVVQWVMTLPIRPISSIESKLDKDCKPESLELLKELERILRANSSNCKWFQYDELRSSTGQFSSENLIGKGGSSRVYKGCLSDGQEMAVKLSKLSKESSKDFLLEVDIITKLHHEGIVPLLGLCIEDSDLISVYSYFYKGSLEESIHGKRSKPPLPWDMRFKVAIGVAEALNYLHIGCSQPVIHRDVKSSNILLNADLEPRLSDFGLALWAPKISPHLTENDVVGTFGYLAPEYFMYGRVSDKIDVYAFGVVLLELLTGRKPICDENPKGQESLVMWATPILEKGDAMELLDPNLDTKYNENQLRRMVLAASLCITRAAHLRPPIDQILSLLKGEGEVEALMNFHNKVAPRDHDDDDDDEESYPSSSINSHLGLVLLDVDDDASISSFEPSNPGSLEEYLRGRWSRSSSFD